MKKNLNDEQLKYLKENYGILDMEQLSKDLDMNRKTIYKLIKENNIQKHTQELDAELVRKDYLIDYLTTKEIAEKYGVANNYVITFLAKNNIKKTKEDIIKSKKVTNIKRYGTEWATQNKDVYNRVKETSLKKYGVDNPHKLQSVVEKTKETTLKKYGVDNYNKTEEGREKLRNRPQFRSLQYYLNKTNINNEYIDIWMDDNKFKDYAITNNGLTIKQISLLFGLDDETVRERVNKLELREYVSLFKHPSRYEDELVEILQSKGITNIERNNKTILDGKEIDIYLPDYNIGIEFNGNYWHCEAESTNTYHQNKSLLALSKGIFIYHIFEYEWNDENKKTKILNQIYNLLQLNTNKIFARKCEVRLVSKKDKDSFLDANHIQGRSASKINLGLYYNDELVSLMTFGISRFNKDCRYELVRYCSKAGTNVVGGANKLFKYFVNQYMISGDKIVSYSDIAKTRGTMYETLGFEYKGYDYPNYIWWNLSSKDIKTRYQCQIKNEIETMHNLGYLRIFDSGAKTWIYTK